MDSPSLPGDEVLLEGAVSELLHHSYQSLTYVLKWAKFNHPAEHEFLGL